MQFKVKELSFNYKKVDIKAVIRLKLIQLNDSFLNIISLYLKLSKNILKIHYLENCKITSHEKYIQRITMLIVKPKIKDKHIIRTSTPVRYL